jgi:hypothetical protein
MLTDLVEYFVVGVPDLESLGPIVPAMRELSEAGTLRLLDWIVVERDADGAVRLPDLAETGLLPALEQISRDAAGLLSEHDIALAASVLPPGTVGLVLVSEDRWAEPLAAAMRGVGGRVIAGERIPSSRVEDALERRRRQAGGGT